MRMKLAAWCLAIMAGVLALAPGTQAQSYGAGGGRWEQLGCAEIGGRPDFDVIHVGRREGRYRAIMLTVADRGVRIEELRVIYGNGQPDRLVVRTGIRPGGRSPPLDLQGRDRAIDRIEIVAQREHDGQGRGSARLCIAGLADEGPGRPHGGQWQPLGCQQVGLAMDRDVIRVGRHEGQFRAIRLEVGGNDVQIENVTVVYGNGTRDQLPVRAFIRQGTATAPLDLRGDRRAIERIELIYRAIPNHRGTARVCASGLG